MKADKKLRVSWDKRERTLMFHYPAGSQTKCDGGYLSGIITEEVAKELNRRGYDKTTIKFSIEPKKDSDRFFDVE